MAQVVDRAHISAPSRWRIRISRNQFRVCVAAFLLFWLSNPFELIVKGVDPTVAAVIDPRTMRTVYSNMALQQCLKAAVFLSFAYPALLQWRTSLRVVTRNPFLCLFTAYVTISALWTDVPGSTITNVIYLLTAMCAGCAIAVTFNARQAAQAFASSGIVITIASLVMVVLVPKYGVHSINEASQGGHAGDWRGVYSHKNELGPLIAIFFSIYAYRGRALFGSAWLQASAGTLALLLVLASTSATAFPVLAVCGAAFMVIFALKGAMKLLVVLLLPVIVLVVYMMKDLLLSSLGRGSDMSGRAEIWAAALRVAAEQPLLGYGYGSNNFGGFSSFVLKRFEAVNAHNGYIDLMLSAGGVGSVLFYGAICFAFYRAAQAWNRTGGELLLVQVLTIFLFGWLVTAYSEVTLRPNTPCGALGIAVITLLSSMAPRPKVPFQHSRPAIPPSRTPMHGGGNDDRD